MFCLETIKYFMNLFQLLSIPVIIVYFLLHLDGPSAPRNLGGRLDVWSSSIKSMEGKVIKKGLSND